MKNNIDLRMEQKQTLSQNQIYSLQMLELDNEALGQFLKNEYLENPMIENYDAGVETDFTRSFGLNEDGPHETGTGNPEEWRTNILFQLNQREYTRTEWKLMESITECLDADGYLKMTIKDIAAFTGNPMEEVEKSLHILKSLEPAGIFAENLSECLLLQLHRKGRKDPVLEAIITDCLDDVAHGYLNRLSRRFGISTLQIKKYIHEIQTLHPRPRLEGMADLERYIKPDIILTGSEDSYQIILNDSWMGNYSIHEYYMRMMDKTKDQELYDYFRNALERARMVIHAIEQRRNTILEVTDMIVKHQTDYFFTNAAKLKPMTMKEIAEKSGVHISTVSRAMKDKYLQTEKRGCILMKELFSAPIVNSAQSCFGAVQIKEKIKELLANEDEHHPYSDAQIAAILSEGEMPVARRTVAKYREELNIPRVSERRL